jgi:hypothetical protein
MHVHMLEPKSKLAEADDDDADADDTTEQDENQADDAASRPQHLAGITAHFLHGGGGGAQAAAAAAAGGGAAAGIGQLMQHADAMLRSDKAQLAAAHTAHAHDKDAVLAERCAPPVQGAPERNPSPNPRTARTVRRASGSRPSTCTHAPSSSPSPYSPSPSPPMFRSSNAPLIYPKPLQSLLQGFCKPSGSLL